MQLRPARLRLGGKDRAVGVSDGDIELVVAAARLLETPFVEDEGVGR